LKITTKQFNYWNNSPKDITKLKTLNFNPFPALTTKRLNLRQLSLNDVNEILLIRSDPRVSEYLDRPQCHDIDEATAFIEKINLGIKNNEWIYWTVTLKEDPKLIGTICLWNFNIDKTKADLGYELLPEYQGKGYMTEAIKAVLNYGIHDLQLAEVEAEVDPANKASVKLLDKFNFTIKAGPGENTDDQGNILPTVIYSLTGF